MVLSLYRNHASPYSCSALAMHPNEMFPMLRREFGLAFIFSLLAIAFGGGDLRGMDYLRAIREVSDLGHREPSTKASTAST